jgi:alkanesulfonate monooxygenase SsuD/methylene tetrahydromethanopterin reductase-like flavin-dependent oxidoreductase (luciferase family)
MANMPALTIVATPGRRQKMIDLAVEAEERGFKGIYVPSLSALMPFCQALLSATKKIWVGTAIQPIYVQHPRELAATAAFLHEMSEGRFRMGLGVSHAPVYDRLNLNVGKPLSDMRDYVAGMRAQEDVGELPPIILATLRNKMLTMSGEIAQGAIWANGARSYVPGQLAATGVTPGDDFFVSNMQPTVVDEDRDAAGAVHKRTLTGYLMLPNYRNYWREAGYADGIDRVEASLAAEDGAFLPDLMSDDWLSDVTLYGSADYIRDEVQKSLDHGITPILVPSSTSGGMSKGIREVFDVFA